MFVPQNVPSSLLPSRNLAQAGTSYFGKDAFFLSARAALLAGLKRRDCDGKAVWLPAFMCRSLLLPLEACKLEIRFYDMDDRLCPDLGSIQANPGDFLLVVHFFGMLFPLGPIVAFAAEKGLTLIEDCAHILPDPAAPVPAGTTGEIAIFSLRKLLPVPSGGVLVDKTPPIESAAPVSRVRVHGFKKRALMLAEAAAFRTGLNFVKIKVRLRGQFGTTDNVHLSGSTDCSMIADDSFAAQLSNDGLRKVASRRRENYRYLVSLIDGSRGVRVPFPVLPPGSCPQVLPLIVERPVAVASILNRLGVEAGLWPGPETIPMSYASFPGTRYWLENLITVPVNQMLHRRHLDFIATALRTTCPGDPR